MIRFDNFKLNEIVVILLLRFFWGGGEGRGRSAGIRFSFAILIVTNYWCLGELCGPQPFVFFHVCTYIIRRKYFWKNTVTQSG